MTAIIFDTETTGTQQPQVIEAACLRLDHPCTLNITEDYEARFQASEPISLGALATHHILDEELEGCPPASSFKLPADVTYLIGHNIDYDWEVIGQPDVKRICTLALARRFYPDLDSHSQSALMYYFARSQARERLQNAHSALADVKNCLFILQAMQNEIGHPDSWEGLWQISEQARIPIIMPFGKHRGELIADLPVDYQDWILRQDGLDPYVKAAVIKSRKGS